MNRLERQASSWAAISYMRKRKIRKPKYRVCDAKSHSHLERKIMFAVLMVLLVLMLIGALPAWPHSRNWGYAPTGGLGLVLTILIILFLLGRI
jgi:Protein of unknown function (DUF3309)